jgi:peroxiredoxin (alkyl hydroperoxide reductase subunit C)
MVAQLPNLHASGDTRLYIPIGYRRTVGWLPQIGDIFPDFSAESTHGRMRFFDWAEGHWTVLFSHPAALTPVCTTEIVSLASSQQDFEARNVKLLGFSGSSYEDQIRWHADIERIFGIPVDFRFVIDADCRMARNFGMMHEKQSADWPIRKTFILDPTMRIRMIFEYPIYIGRATEEILRVVDALRMQDATELAIPADWEEGEELIFPEDGDAAATMARYGKRFTRLSPYLAVVAPDDAP